MKRACASLVAVYLVCHSALSDQPSKSSPAGTWTMTRRDVKGPIELIITKNRLHWTRRLDSGKLLVIEADYSVTKDNILYGIITRIDNKPPGSPPAPSEEDTFSFHFWADDDQLYVVDIRGIGFNRPEFKKRLQGRYTKKTEANPPSTDKKK